MLFPSLFHAPLRHSPHRRDKCVRACAEALESRRLMSFASAAGYAAGDAPQDVATEDFNGDGQLDAMSC